MDAKRYSSTHIPRVILGIIGAFHLSSVVALRPGVVRERRLADRGRFRFRLSGGLPRCTACIIRPEGHERAQFTTRATPAVINNDGLNYVPTNRYVLFGRCPPSPAVRWSGRYWLRRWAICRGHCGYWRGGFAGTGLQVYGAVHLFPPQRRASGEMIRREVVPFEAPSRCSAAS